MVAEAGRVLGTRDTPKTVLHPSASEDSHGSSERQMAGFIPPRQPVINLGGGGRQTDQQGGQEAGRGKEGVGRTGQKESHIGIWSLRAQSKFVPHLGRRKVLANFLGQP